MIVNVQHNELSMHVNQKHKLLSDYNNSSREDNEIFMGGRVSRRKMLVAYLCFVESKETIL